MKNLKIGLLTIALLALTAVAGLTPRAQAQSVSSANGLTLRSRALTRTFARLSGVQ